ncbi:MAG: 30S ribosomal protein S24e, partial [Candidatus Thorarchaeota archaeon]
MKIEILQEKENKPLARREIDFRVEHIGGTTPSRADVLAKIVAQFDADSSAVVIKSLNTKFGIGITEGTARIYSDA